MKLWLLKKDDENYLLDIEPEDVHGSKSTGYAYGRMAEDYSLGVKSIRARVEHNMQKQFDGAKARSSALENKIQRLNEKARGYFEEITSTASAIKQLKDDKNKNPSDFSTPRGLFYVFNSLILLIADIAIISRVVSIVFDAGYSFDGQDGVFLRDLVTSPIRSFFELTDTMSLTLTMVLVGFFLKGFLDFYKKKHKHDAEKYIDLMYIISKYFLLLSALTILSAALLRVYFQYQGVDDIDAFHRGWLTLAMQGVLGVSVPVVGVGFFILGTDILGNRLRLCCLEAKSVIYNHLLNRCYYITDSLQSRYDETIASMLNFKGGSTYFQRVVDHETALFKEGYVSGLTSVIGPDADRGVIDRLLPLVIKMNLSRRKDT